MLEWDCDKKSGRLEGEGLPALVRLRHFVHHLCINSKQLQFPVGICHAQYWPINYRMVTPMQRITNIS